ncbi:hypothetical protein ACFWM7_00905 [Streptomyces sp. NPDC058375]|uniref:hypothetical protein n=1 Tax=Streptomyces sp. NPDC058375 TaxID=3346467 RepID=UPI003654EA33
MSRLLEAAAPPHPWSSSGTIRNNARSTSTIRNNTRSTGTTRSTSRTRTTRHAPEEPSP